MTQNHNVFDFETRIDELFEIAFPKAPPKLAQHSSGRGFKPFYEFSLGSLVPGGSYGRIIQQQREYVKVDFSDFIDYATTELPPRPELSQFSDQTAVFYESISPVAKPDPDAVWGEKWKFSIRDAVVARDNVFLSVIMRFVVWIRDHKVLVQPEEFGVTIIFAPESYSHQTTTAGPLSEWERVTWWPPINEDNEWRFITSGAFTAGRLREMEAEPSQPFSKEALQRIRSLESQNYTEWGALYEVARLGLHLASYTEFMYDLVIMERVQAGVMPHRETGKSRRGKQVTFDKPIYKIIRSVRIIRPEYAHEAETSYRHWTAPSFSFLVHGHWRQFDDKHRKGHDSEGNEVLGKTWIRSYRKYEDKSEQPVGLCSTRNPQIVIGIKQTLSHARDIIATCSSNSQLCSTESPSEDWIINERAKLTAGLRYLILKRDGFRCTQCGKSPIQDNYVRLEVDHKIPVSQWGQTVEENLQTLCRECNRGKSANS